VGLDQHRCEAALFDAGGPPSAEAGYPGGVPRLRARSHAGRRHVQLDRSCQAELEPSLQAVSGAARAHRGARHARLGAAGAPPLQPARRRCRSCALLRLRQGATTQRARVCRGRIRRDRYDPADPLVPPPAAGTHGPPPLHAAPLLRVRPRLRHLRLRGAGVRRRAAAAARAGDGRPRRRHRHPVRPDGCRQDAHLELDGRALRGRARQRRRRGVRGARQLLRGGHGRLLRPAQRPRQDPPPLRRERGATYSLSRRLLAT
jgi:hypothetical protein